MTADKLWVKAQCSAAKGDYGFLDEGVDVSHVEMWLMVCFSVEYVEIGVSLLVVCAMMWAMQWASEESGLLTTSSGAK